VPSRLCTRVWEEPLNGAGMKKKKLRAIMEETIKETVHELLDSENPSRAHIELSGNGAVAPKPTPVNGTPHLASPDAWASP
jgi:hypothetical protein